MAPPTETPIADTIEHQADEDRGDLVELLGTGYIRIRTQATRYRLRPPLIGELRKLRTALAEAMDDVADRRDEAMQLSEKLVADAQKIADNESLTDPQRRKQLGAIKAKSRKGGRELTDHADDVRLEWWTKVFAALSLDGQPAEWPASMLDHNLPEKVMQHWRTAPLDRG